MKLPESKRPELTASNPDPSVFRQSAPHPGEALVLDEDVQAQTLISPLRSRNIHSETEEAGSAGTVG